MIPQRNISLIANDLAADGGRRIPEAVIERDYVLAWFLNGLALLVGTTPCTTNERTSAIRQGFLGRTSGTAISGMGSIFAAPGP